MMKQGPANLIHTKLSDKKGEQINVISAKSEPKVQRALKTSTIL